MEVVHTCSDVRYWSEGLCCTVPTIISHLEVTNLEKNYVGLKILKAKCDADELRCPAPDLVNSRSHSQNLCFRQENSQNTVVHYCSSNILFAEVAGW